MNMLHFLSAISKLTTKYGVLVASNVIIGCVHSLNVVIHLTLPTDLNAFSIAIFACAACLHYGFALGARIATVTNLHNEILERKNMIERLKK